MVVRRAVTLGLPVALIGQESQQEDNVAHDYRKVADEMMNHTPEA
jgi:chromosome partitioning protein